VTVRLEQPRDHAPEHPAPAKHEDARHRLEPANARAVESRSGQDRPVTEDLVRELEFLGAAETDGLLCSGDVLDRSAACDYLESHFGEDVEAIRRSAELQYVEAIECAKSVGAIGDVRTEEDSDSSPIDRLVEAVQATDGLDIFRPEVTRADRHRCPAA